MADIKKCNKCNKENLTKFAWCELCRNAKSYNEKQRKEKARNLGLCSKCSAPSNLLTCEECKTKSNISSRKSKNKKKSEGKCKDCGAPITKFTLCKECLAKTSARNSIRTKKLKSSNLCVNCGKNPPFNGSQCRSCLDIKNTANRQIKLKVFSHYGETCVCCKEAILEFLTIDHINGGGKKHRQELTKKKDGGGGITTYKWLIKNDLPMGYQVMCYNCNLGKHLNKGICPHIRLNTNLITDHYKVKKQVMDHYGHGKCGCCGENQLLFLTIDHINGGGKKHTAEIGGGHKLYLWLKRNGYPIGFSVLCMNCNSGKGINQNCPHYQINLIK